MRDLRRILEQHVAADDVVDAERDGKLAEEPPASFDGDPCSSSTNDDAENSSIDDAPDAPAVDDLFTNSAFDGWKDKVQPDLDEPERSPETLLVGELLLTYFEWMCVHKVTNECARSVHTMISLLVPPDSSNLPEWIEIHSMLDVVYKHVVVEVDLCPNDCIAFVDATHPVLVEAGYMHSHRTSCHMCGAARYKRELEDGDEKKVPVKRGYYFPIDQYVANIFRDSQSVQHRHHNTGTFPPGHVRRSKGFYEKVTANDHMNKEPRNQTFIGMADGIPLFRSIKTSLGVVVGALRQANQPDYISKLFKKIHLSVSSMLTYANMF